MKPIRDRITMAFIKVQLGLADKAETYMVMTIVGLCITACLGFTYG